MFAKGFRQTTQSSRVRIQTHEWNKVTNLERRATANDQITEVRKQRTAQFGNDAQQLRADGSNEDSRTKRLHSSQMHAGNQFVVSKGNPRKSVAGKKRVQLKFIFRRKSLSPEAGAPVKRTVLQISKEGSVGGVQMTGNEEYPCANVFQPVRRET
jgi:hypothetical protein